MTDEINFLDQVKISRRLKHIAKLVDRELKKTRSVQSVHLGWSTVTIRFEY